MEMLQIPRPIFMYRAELVCSKRTRVLFPSLQVKLDHCLMLFSENLVLGREAATEYSNKWLLSEECPVISMEQPCHFSANPLRTLRKEDKMSAALLGLPS